MFRTLNSNEMTEIEIVVNEIYKDKGITEDVNSLYQENDGKIANNKYVVGEVKKKMPTLTDFQKRLEERD